MDEDAAAAPRVTRDDVARVAGVSVAVVSYVINDGPRAVSASARERVLAAVDELGYRPNAVARALKTGQTATLGLVVPDNRNPYFAELAHALEDAAFHAGFALLVANSNNDADRESAQLAALRDRQVDGIFVIPTGPVPATTGSAIPVVLLDRAAADSPYSSVAVDNRAGAEAGTRHLIEVHGHRRIACLTGPEGSGVAGDRERGWRAAMEAAGLEPGGLVVHSDFTRDAGYRAGLGLLGGPEAPAAVFVASDVQAIGLLRACQELRIPVPDALAVVAFDGTEESAFTAPPLTVVRQLLPDIAAAALRLMQGGRGATRHDVAPFDLVLRASCGCPPT